MELKSGRGCLLVSYWPLARAYPPFSKTDRYQDSVTQHDPFVHACAKTASKIYSLIDSARDYSSSARGLGSSQNGAIVNDGGM